VAAHLRGRPLADWMTIFDGADACVTPVLTPAEALAHPQAIARRVVRRAGAVTEVGPLAQLSGYDVPLRPAPRAGEHTRELLVESGLDGAAIDALLAAGVVKEPR
jgi:alpha-methylacyl-CoA racemase